MNPRFLGNSYDIVKQSLIRWLNEFGPWAAHPMFTESVRDSDTAALTHFLGIDLLSTEVLDQETDRRTYFAGAQNCESHLFLDPDTGIRLKVTRGIKAPSYLFGEELVSIAHNRPNLFTLGFDQSLPRGRERDHVETKLEYFASHGLSGIAYVSHACFVLVSRESNLVNQALDAISQKSRLPANRLVVREANSLTEGSRWTRRL